MSYWKAFRYGWQGMVVILIIAHYWFGFLR